MCFMYIITDIIKYMVVCENLFRHIWFIIYSSCKNVAY